jgi:hypothetical protein
MFWLYRTIQYFYLFSLIYFNFWFRFYLYNLIICKKLLACFNLFNIKKLLASFNHVGVLMHGAFSSAYMTNFSAPPPFSSLI